jgi:hypothetical protein
LRQVPVRRHEVTSMRADECLNTSAYNGAAYASTGADSTGAHGSPDRPKYRFDGTLPPALQPLRDRPQWVTWDYVWNSKNKKWDKPPRSAHNGRAASINKDANLGTFEQAAATATRLGLAGVGFVLKADDPYTGIDLDDCITDSGSFSPLVAEIIGYSETYAELSPSGEGVRLFALGKPEKTLKKDTVGIEVYGDKRYLTVTGRQIEGAPNEISPAPKALAKLTEVVAAAQAAKGAKANGKARPNGATDSKPYDREADGAEAFWSKVNTAALINLDRWVPVLHPTAEKQATGAWRVAPQDLGRPDLEEDLSYHPSGIRYFGEEFGLTPIDAVQRFGSASDAAAATSWLCLQLGVEPASLGWRGAVPEEDDADLAKMNGEHAVVRVGGKTRVVTMEESVTHPGCKVPVFSTMSDFCAFHAHPHKPHTTATGKPCVVGLGRWWLGQERRRQFNGIVYAPNATARTVDGKLNLWTGFSCKPGEGDCSLYLGHLFNNVCSGNKDHLEYLLNWMSYAVQYPGRPGEVAVVLRGTEGIGKGVAAKHFGQLLGPHYVHVSQAGHLTGHFNAHLQQCSVLFADEAFFAGDRSHEGTLKALITEDTLMIEPKGLDSFPVRNCLHIIMSSNNDWVIPAGADARRYFVLTVSDARKQHYAYFAAIVDEMDAGGREALLRFLLARDLSGFNVRNVPQTDALADQKTYSRRGVDRLIETIAHDETLPACHPSYPNVAVTTGESRGEGLYPRARLLAPDLKHVSSIVISKTLKREWGCKPWKSGGERGITFPPLAVLRAAFDQKHGRQDWPKYEGERDSQNWGDR